MITCENLFFCKNLFLSMIISENLIESLLYAKISSYFCLSVKIFSYLCSYFWGDSFELHFLRKQFWSAPMFWNAFSEGTIILISWFIAADYCGCCSMFFVKVLQSCMNANIPGMHKYKSRVKASWLQSS